MSHIEHPYRPALSTAETWLRHVADALGTEDLGFTGSVLRAWLHVVRDQVAVATAAHFAAQLPTLLRGIYYESWVPAHVPVRHDAASLIEQFSREAGVDPQEAAALLGAVTGALNELFSPGHLGHVLAVLPVRLRSLLRGDEFDGPLTGATAEPAATGHRQAVPLEARLRTVAEAVAVLARGLENLPIAEEPDHVGAAAQQAHRLLLAEGLIGAVTH